MHGKAFSICVFVVMAISAGNAQISGDRSPMERGFRPKLSMPDALKAAEKFVDSKHVDLTHFWLYEAKYRVFGGLPQYAGWYFWWVNESGALGDYVEVFVTMDGKCRRLPSM